MLIEHVEDEHFEESNSKIRNGFNLSFEDFPWWDGRVKQERKYSKAQLQLWFHPT